EDRFLTGLTGLPGLPKGWDGQKHKRQKNRKTRRLTGGNGAVLCFVNRFFMKIIHRVTPQLL
ncbi:MAG TPA: hypothetical protein VNT26_19760, partial [Candidatus Sulfotelmatobacter sp.]|nr:hypothetical protein [Candidatus Sulfotelmatobacter sp.]